MVNTKERVALSRPDRKNVGRDVKPQYKQQNNQIKNSE